MYKGCKGNLMIYVQNLNFCWCLSSEISRGIVRRERVATTFSHLFHVLL